MESTIYQESPLAEYLEGQGEASPEWHPAEGDSKPDSQDDKPSFAPSGPSRSRPTRIQELLTPLRIRGHRRNKTWTALQDICSAAISVRASASQNNRFLDQFRYSIIASQLLIPATKPQVDTRYAPPLEDAQAPPGSGVNTFSLQGAAVTGAISFFTAWTLHLVRVQSPVHYLNALITSLLLAVVAITVYGYARRKASQRVRRVAFEALADLITNSHALDTIARSAFRLIQEVEIVSSGYEISSPLPPVSRLESRGPNRQCSALRIEIADVISSVIHHYLQSHATILPFVDATDMLRYHEIYDVSPQDYQGVLQGPPSPFDDDSHSLKGLKASLVRLFIARQIFLCDLLALPSNSSEPDITRWSVISFEITNLSQQSRHSALIVGRSFNEVNDRQWGDQPRSLSKEDCQSEDSQRPDTQIPQTPGKEKVKAQLRRLDSLSQSIRALNARMLLMREEANNLIAESKPSADVSHVLARQYDLVGAELRTLVSDWEHGRTTMLLSLGPMDRGPSSRSSGELRLPSSPVYSLGGITAVNEGSPAEALKRLTGEGFHTSSTDGIGSDEDVFEAMSQPIKPKRMSMTREEKLARMQEDRRKRATAQETRDATTSMLRELETVIKHRPRGRTTSRITSV